MDHINPKSVIENRIAQSMGFEKYKQIMETVRKTNVFADRDFQRIFNGFYRVRRNAVWQKTYYGLFEKIKNDDPSFEYILRTLYEQMVCWYHDFLKTENGRECIDEFNRTLPGYRWMTEVKKIDFYLWSMR